MSLAKHDATGETRLRVEKIRMPLTVRFYIFACLRRLKTAVGRDYPIRVKPRVSNLISCLASNERYVCSVMKRMGYGRVPVFAHSSSSDRRT